MRLSTHVAFTIRSFIHLPQDMYTTLALQQLENCAHRSLTNARQYNEFMNNGSTVEVVAQE